MDKHSEVEAKFLSDTISKDEFEEFASVVRWVGTYNQKRRTCDEVEFKRLLGTDTFYKMGSGIVRHRTNWKKGSKLSNWSTLTVKKRKSADSLEDRDEVDLNIDKHQSREDVTAFMKLTKAKKMFTLLKDYSIYKFLSSDKQHLVCLAWYRVSREDGSDAHNFIEVEVEKESKCSTHVGKMVLADWKEAININLDLDAPLNASLFEMYSLPRAHPKSIVNMTRPAVLTQKDVTEAFSKSHKADRILSLNRK